MKKLKKISVVNSYIYISINIIVALLLQLATMEICNFYKLLLGGEPLPFYSYFVLKLCPYLLYILSFVLFIFFKKIKSIEKVVICIFCIVYLHIIIYFLIFSALVYPTLFITFKNLT